jgi:hypothetical protein
MMGLDREQHENIGLVCLNATKDPSVSPHAIDRRDSFQRHYLENVALILINKATGLEAL